VELSFFLFRLKYNPWNQRSSEINNKTTTPHCIVWIKLKLRLITVLSYIHSSQLSRECLWYFIYALRTTCSLKKIGITKHVRCKFRSFQDLHKQGEL